jgi:hypothetical protein
MSRDSVVVGETLVAAFDVVFVLVQFGGKWRLLQHNSQMPTKESDTA